MSAENQIVSVEFEVEKRIQSQLEEMLEAESVSLPGVGHPLVEDYIRKIEGTYDVTRSKEDTDHAIELLYIAYNTTPPGRDVIRNDLSDIMKRLILAQQDSERKMKRAVSDAGRTLKALNKSFGKWTKTVTGDDSSDLENFIGKEMFKLAQDIKRRAERIYEDLNKVAETYDGILEDTEKTTSKSETALKDELKNKDEIEKEITKNNAERKRLKSLISDLQADIAKYEKLANEYKSQAETAEERAFIMSIVRVGAEMISSAVPAITAGITGAATGGTSLIAASAASTARQFTNSDTTDAESDNTKEVIETKKEISKKQSELDAAREEKAKLEKKAGELETEKEKIESDDDKDSETKAKELEAINDRIEANKSEIEKNEKEILAATTALNSLNEALKSLGKNMGELAEKQEKQAESLRKLQMDMLNKVEAYETERRNQAAELVKIKALLKGQRTDEEKIKLAIKSLHLSLKALKRVQEIILEISFFFKSFADFMQLVMDDSEDQASSFEDIDSDDLDDLQMEMKEFFITQTSEWQAAEIVSAKFVDNFNLGWSKLNKLKGNYLAGDELKSYLAVAAEKIEEISFKRQEAATAKLAKLQEYRERISAGA